MGFIGMLTGNRILDISIYAWILAQALKLLITYIFERRLIFRRIWESGGMPSSHSAFVCACATSTGRICGIDSPFFAIAVVLAIVVMYDALNVRRAAGEQAKILNYIMMHWSETTPEMFGKELKELLGHTPVQVAAGAVLGIILGMLV